MQILSDKPVIGIIGGHGKMGRWFGDFFAAGGLEVSLWGRSSGISVGEFIKPLDAIVISVPISVTPQVIDEVAPRVRPGQILMDLTSLKVSAVEAMLRTPAEVLGLHPMFGPHVSAITGQTVVVCRARPERYTPFFIDYLREAGACIKETTPEEHDRMMAVIQGLNHFTAIALAEALRRLNVDIDSTLAFTSPIYRLRADMIGRILAQDAELYADIEVHNPYSTGAIAAFMEGAGELARFVNERDADGFAGLFRAAADHLGDFKQRALEESSRLVSYLAEEKS